MRFFLIFLSGFSVAYGLPDGLTIIPPALLNPTAPSGAVFNAFDTDYYLGGATISENGSAFRITDVAILGDDRTQGIGARFRNPQGATADQFQVVPSFDQGSLIVGGVNSSNQLTLARYDDISLTERYAFRIDLPVSAIPGSNVRSLALTDTENTLLSQPTAMGGSLLSYDSSGSFNFYRDYRPSSPLFTRPPMGPNPVARSVVTAQISSRTSSDTFFSIDVIQSGLVPGMTVTEKTILRLSESGEIRWSRIVAQGGSGQGAVAVAPLADDNLLLTRQSVGFGGGSFNSEIALVNGSTGELVWARVVPGHFISPAAGPRDVDGRIFTLVLSDFSASSTATVCELSAADGSLVRSIDVTVPNQPFASAALTLNRTHLYVAGADTDANSMISTNVIVAIPVTSSGFGTAVAKSYRAPLGSVFAVPNQDGQLQFQQSNTENNSVSSVLINADLTPRDDCLVLENLAVTTSNASDVMLVDSGQTLGSDSVTVSTADLVEPSRTEVDLDVRPLQLSLQECSLPSAPSGGGSSGTQRIPISSITVSATEVQITVPNSINGEIYQLLSSPDLETAFAPVGVQAGNGGEITFRAPRTTTDRRGFYRVEITAVTLPPGGGGLPTFP